MNYSNQAGEILPITFEEIGAPAIGDIVHYQKYGTPGGEYLSEPSPAMITRVIDKVTKECQLCVLNPNGIYFNATPYSEIPKSGHWNWPVKSA